MQLVARDDTTSNALRRIHESTSVDGDDLVDPNMPAGPSGNPDLSASEKVAIAASAVAWLEVMLEGLRNGTRTWADWDESLEETPDRSEVAISRCEAELAKAREDLRALTRPGGADTAPGAELQRAQQQ